MALKPDRNLAEETDIRQHWLSSQTAAEKGGCASLSTAGSGVALDSAENLVSYAASASGAVPMGILLQTVSPVLSATRDFINKSNLEVRPGDKVTLVRKGSLVTDMIIGTPAVGDIAYLAASGNIGTASGVGRAASPPWVPVRPRVPSTRIVFCPCRRARRGGFSRSFQACSKG